VPKCRTVCWLLGSIWDKLVQVRFRTDMTFHLCCTQPQRTFGFWFRALAAVGSEKLGIWISFLPACNSLRGSGLKVAAERHLSAQNYTLLKHIKSHLVGHSAPHPHKLTHTHRKSPQDALAFSQQSLFHTYTHTLTQWALSFCGWHSSPVLPPLSLSLHRPRILGSPSPAEVLFACGRALFMRQSNLLLH